MNGRKWTDEELKKLSEMYPNASVEDLCAEFKRPITKIYAAANKRGLRRSAEYMASPAAYILRRNRLLGAAFHYPKGHVPANKGTRRPGYSVGRMGETQFKKGQRSQTWKPVGTILPDGEGYLRIKVRERAPGDASGWDKAVWPLLSKHNWGKKHGPMPPGHKLIFIDGDRSNCDTDNLELISDAEMMRRNSIHRLPKELKQVIQLKGLIRATVTRRKKRLGNA